MSDFAFLYRTGGPAMSPEQVQQVLPKWHAWMQTLIDRGHMIDRGQPLERSGKLVGATIVDGPFAEAKDVIGGFTLIRARDITEAAELARDCPVVLGGGQVEVRPVMKMDR